jgi:CBS domain-containing protein
MGEQLIGSPDIVGLEVVRDHRLAFICGMADLPQNPEAQDAPKLQAPVRWPFDVRQRAVAFDPGRIDLPQSHLRRDVVNEKTIRPFPPGKLEEGCMRAKQVMSKPVHVVAAGASVYDAAQVLLNAGVSAAPVVDPGGRMVGIVSEADLMHRPEIGTVPGKSWLQRLLADNAVTARDYIHSHSHRVADVMTQNVVTADERTSLADIAALMQRHRVKRIPILRDGKIVGIVSRANLLQGLLAREPSPSKDIAADETLRSLVTTELARHGWAVSQSAGVVAENGVVHLWGHVDSDTVKDACQVAAEAVRGVKRVENHMDVLPPELRFCV